MTGAPAIVVNDLHIHYEVLTDRRDRFLDVARRGFSFRRSRQVRALTGVSFDLLAGESLGVIGHNGAGKTTLLQAIAGLIAPSAGSVLVSAQPQILGVQAALSPLSSGRRNIELGCLALGLSQSETKSITPEIIDFTQLGDFIDMPVHTYSAGMAQRLSFAISTVNRPEILLIDEALAVGDQFFRKRSLTRLRALRDTAGAVVLASHTLQEVRENCTKALWLHEGHMEMFGDPDEVVDAYEADTRQINRKVEGGGN